MLTVDIFCCCCLYFSVKTISTWTRMISLTPWKKSLTVTGASELNVWLELVCHVQYHNSAEILDFKTYRDKPTKSGDSKFICVSSCVTLPLCDYYAMTSLLNKPWKFVRSVEVLGMLFFLYPPVNFAVLVTHSAACFCVSDYTSTVGLFAP